MTNLVRVSTNNTETHYRTSTRWFERRRWWCVVKVWMACARQRTIGLGTLFATLAWLWPCFFPLVVQLVVTVGTTTTTTTSRSTGLSSFVSTWRDRELVLPECGIINQGLLLVQQWKQNQPIIWSGHFNGLGDRLRGMMNALAVSVILGRPFIANGSSSLFDSRYVQHGLRDLHWTATSEVS